MLKLKVFLNKLKATNAFGVEPFVNKTAALRGRFGVACVWTPNTFSILLK